MVPYRPAVFAVRNPKWGSCMKEWQSFFEHKAAASDGDSLGAVDYTIPGVYHNLVETFRRVCGPLPPSAIVLDAGCGNGFFWKSLFAPHPVIGVDFSPNMCTLARAKGLTAYDADLLSLPFPEHYFDLIYCASTIQCFSDLSPLLAEFTRVCKPDGKIIVGTTNRDSFIPGLVRLIRRIFPRDDLPGLRPRSADEITAAAQGLPLSVASVTRIGYPFPQVNFGPLAYNIVVEFRRH
jgi:SAM-dependent methyltransferase